MSNARKTKVPAISDDAVIQKKVAAINANLDAESEESHDSVTRHD